jgi:hypothetical protein
MTLQKSEEKKNIAKKHKKITFQILVENAKKSQTNKKKINPASTTVLNIKRKAPPPQNSI